MSVDTDHSQMWNNHKVLFLAVPGMWQLHLTSFIPLAWPRQSQLYCTCVWMYIHAHISYLCYVVEFTVLDYTPVDRVPATWLYYKNATMGTEARCMRSPGCWYQRPARRAHKLQVNTIYNNAFRNVFYPTSNLANDAVAITRYGDWIRIKELKSQRDAWCKLLWALLRYRLRQSCESAQQKVRPLDELRLRALGRDTEWWWWTFTTCDYSLNVLWHWFRK